MTKTNIHKWVAILVSFLIIGTLFSMLPITNLTASAISCQKDGFDKSRYTLSGNMAEDVATIAKSQKGRTGAQFGYTEAWCDEFVADCIENAGADSSIVGHGGTVADFESIMRQKKGAVEVSSPQVGDLVFFTYSHVEIVTKVENGTVYCAGGNNGGTGNYKTNYCAGERKLYATARLYLRPNYKNINVEPPTYARLDKNQVLYDLQDTIELYPTSDKATDFWLTVKKDDTVIKSEHVDVGGSLKFYAGDYGAGNYYAWTTAYNSAGGVDSDGIDFSIVDGVGYSYIGSSQSAYSLSDEVSIKVDTICAKGQVIGIDRIGDGRVITESCDSPYTIPAKNLGTGLYGTYFSVYNGSACVDTKWDFFSIDNETEKPANVSLKADKDWYDADDNITLSPSSTNASVYWICIRKNGSDIVNQKIIGDYTFNATEYGCGEYYAWISAVNSCGSTDSSGITFSIVQSASYEDVYSKKDVYNIEDMVSLTVEPLFAEGQALHIDNADTGENILYVLSDETYRIEANKLGKGKFNAYFTVYNGTGSLNTEIIKFEIVDSKNIVGDCNNDGQFSIADIIALQKWLLNDDTELANWQAADFSKDNILSISDLCIMKNKLLSIKR